MEDKSTLDLIAEKIDLTKLTGKPEDFYKTGLAFVESGQFDDGILEFVKVIKICLPANEIYELAVKELKSMGFNDEDIPGKDHSNLSVNTASESVEVVNTTSPKISGNERNKAAFAYFTTFLSLLLPIGFGLLFSSEGSFPSWTNFLYHAGGAVGALICGLIYWGNMRTSQFVSNHSRKAAKINIVCTIAITLIALLFFNALDGPEALLPGIFMMPFIFGGPFIGFVSIISIYTQNKNL